MAAAHGWAPVNVVPQPKAGGSFATAAYQGLGHPWPLSTSERRLDWISEELSLECTSGRSGSAASMAVTHIGEALVLSARTRPKFIGGSWRPAMVRSLFMTRRREVVVCPENKKLLESLVFRVREAKQIVPLATPNDVVL